MANKCSVCQKFFIHGEKRVGSTHESCANSVVEKNDEKAAVISVSDDKKEKENITVACSICDCVLQKDHIGVVCSQSHNLCSECAVNFVNSSLEDPTTPTPPKCPVCKADVIAASFERQLDNNQRGLYLSFVALKSVDESMRLVNCPSCSYFEIWPKSLSGMDTFFCRNHQCKKQSCAHCKLECSLGDEGGFSEDDFVAGFTDSTSYMYHMECADLAPSRKIIEEAISRGLGMVCPSCGHFGRKDDACTHIRCVKCQMMYCYVCGLGETTCDKENPDGSIYSHNEDWDLNPLRCPMYLSEVNQIDDRWTDNDDECVAFASRLRTLGNLRGAVERLGPAKFEHLRQKYNSIKNCGFSVDEILHEDLTFIRRPDLEDT